MDKIEVQMELDRETKGTVLYKQDNPNLPIYNIYVKKAALPKPFPLSIKVTVEAAA